MRTRFILAPVAIVLLACISCGQEFKLPPQPTLEIPEPGWNLSTEWTGIPSPTDLALRGSFLYVIQEDRRLVSYYSWRQFPDSVSRVVEFEGLIRPVRVCLASENNQYIFVADAGDMTIKRYDYLGGPPQFTFQDTTWVEFSGIAADQDLNVYVSDASRDLVYRYDAQGNAGMLVSDFGTGQGYVIAPHGLVYSKGALWIADTGKNWVQRLRADMSHTPIDGRPIGLDLELRKPIDVATDPEGESIIFTEELNNRVLRFEPSGAFQDTVYSPTKKLTMVDPPVLAPRYIASDETRVFLADSTNDRIVVFRLVNP